MLDMHILSASIIPISFVISIEFFQFWHFDRIPMSPLCSSRPLSHFTDDLLRVLFFSIPFFRVIKSDLSHALRFSIEYPIILLFVLSVRESLGKP
jgi:hypothetical protein